MVKTKLKTVFQCQACGAEVPQYLGRCPECQQWNTLLEQTVDLKKGPGGSGQLGLDAFTAPQMLQDICLTDKLVRFSTGYQELDRVLGGGLIPGAYFLFGGDPGIGKSTLMLQVAQNIADDGKTVLYVAGEESPHQIKLRADRLDISGKGILIYPQTSIHQVMDEIKTARPHVVIIDSIQSVYDPDLSGTPGSISQMKACAGHLMNIAKVLDVTVLLVGHVTKEGEVSGPKLLEHTVDGVLYFEGEKFRNLRILRAVKNRFGSTLEIGVFEMGEAGLSEVTNPSELFLSESSFQHHPGSAIVATLEGNRPILVEVQALVGLSTYASPRRVANGIDVSRLHQIVAVLERRLGLDFSKQDIYVNVVGGLRIQEPAADLGIALALVSSHYQVPLKHKTVIAGEIGLTGEVRSISHYNTRIAEAQKLGFESIVLPTTRQAQEPLALHGIQRIEIRSLMEALKQCLDQNAPLSQDKGQHPQKGDPLGCP